MGKNPTRLPSKSTTAEIDAFLAKTASIRASGKGRRRGRLIFALDATASRQPTWDQACHIQSEMFVEAQSLGGLCVQLCHFGGFQGFHHSPWLTSSNDLLEHMSGVICAAGMTQIERVLRHALAETRQGRVNALVYIGDCMEEDIDRLAGLAGELGLLQVPVFLFHEGADSPAQRAFREIARLSRGAYCRFDAHSADQLRQLLGAVAAYAAGGREALLKLESQNGGLARQISHQLK